MINRVLIRMKTVQLLYSYLLVEKPFELAAPAESPTKEKRFAYSLYLDMIYLMVRVAHKVQGKNKDYPLVRSRFIIACENDDKYLVTEKKYSAAAFPYASAEDILRDEIKSSLLFKEYEKSIDNSAGPEKLWEDIFKAIIIQNPTVKRLIEEQPEYTLAGMERMTEMMQQTFTDFYSSSGNISEALNTLELSMQKARNLYMRLLALPVELTRLRLNRLEQNRRKLLATNEDLNPNMKLVNNLIPEAIEKNASFEEYVEKNHLSWQEEDPELLDRLLKAVMDSEVYKNYASERETDIVKDSEFWRDVFVEVILNNKDFLEYLENKSVFWNDDLEIMTSFVVKTLKLLERPESSEDAIMPMYKDGEHGKDAMFGAELFSYVIKNKEVYRKYIQDVLAADKWEADRLAFMDFVITMTALAEIINYPEIPVTVSINEYIEIAKSYSSAKSGQFVHGLLASLISKLKEEGIIRK